MRRQVAERGRPGRAQTGVQCAACGERFTGEEFGEPALVGRRDVDRLHGHAAARHRREDRVGGAFLQDILRRRAPGWLIVAARAVVLVECGGIRSLRVNRDGTAEAVPYEQRQRADRENDKSRTQHGAPPTLNPEHGTSNPDRRTANPERRTPTPNAEPRTPNREPRTTNGEPRTPNREPRTPNREPRTTNGE